MSHARGRVIGKVIHMRPVDDVDDQFGESDQWSDCEEEDEGKEIA
jgi:hypothetical protein